MMIVTVLVVMVIRAVMVAMGVVVIRGSRHPGNDKYVRNKQ